MDPKPAGNRIEANRPSAAPLAGESGPANANLATAPGVAAQPAAPLSQGKLAQPSKPGPQEVGAKISIDPMRSTDRYRLVHPATDQV